MTNREKFIARLGEPDIGLKAFDPESFDDESLESTMLQNHRDRFFKILEVTKHSVKKMFPDIYFDYIDLDQINGLAWVDQKQGFVGIPFGAILKSYDTAYRMLSHPKIMPHLGNSAAEIIQPFHSLGIRSGYNQLVSMRGAKFAELSSLRPRDPERLKYADGLAQMMIDFLMLHEIGHIRLGHCEFPSVTKLHSVIFESVPFKPPISPDQNLADQAIEMHADAFALQALIHNWVIHTPKEISEWRMKLEGEADAPNFPGVKLNSFELSLSDILIASNTFFWIAGWDLDPDDLMDSDHPPTIGRFSNCIAIQERLSLYPEAGSDVKRSFRLAFETAVFRVGIAQDIIGGSEDHHALMVLSKTSTLDSIMQHQQRLAEEFLKIWDKLATLRYDTDFSTPEPLLIGMKSMSNKPDKNKDDSGKDKKEEKKDDQQRTNYEKDDPRTTTNPRIVRGNKNHDKPENDK